MTEGRLRACWAQEERRSRDTALLSPPLLEKAAVFPCLQSQLCPHATPLSGTSCSVMPSEAASLCLPDPSRQLQGLGEAQGTSGLATNSSKRTKGGTRIHLPHGHRAGSQAVRSPVQALSDIFSPASGKCNLALARSCCAKMFLRCEKSWRCLTQ